MKSIWLANIHTVVSLRSLDVILSWMCMLSQRPNLQKTSRNSITLTYEHFVKLFQISKSLSHLFQLKMCSDFIFHSSFTPSSFLTNFWLKWILNFKKKKKIRQFYPFCYMTKNKFSLYVERATWKLLTENVFMFDLPLFLVFFS